MNPSSVQAKTTEECLHNLRLHQVCYDSFEPNFCSTFHRTKMVWFTHHSKIQVKTSTVRSLTTVSTPSFREIAWLLPFLSSSLKCWFLPQWHVWRPKAFPYSYFSADYWFLQSAKPTRNNQFLSHILQPIGPPAI